MPRILLVEEDEEDAQEIRRAFGHRRDLEIVRVASVLDAIRTAGETSFDAAILDYELPDGTGLDLLDFLRIGSPGIRIVIVSETGSEALALQALSHGAGDWILKDHHLERELPRRIEALLDHVDSTAAFVETLAPAAAYEDADVRDDVAPPAAERARREAFEALAQELVQGPVFAAGVFDHRGRPLAVRLVPPLDPDGVGFGLATIHAQIGGLWSTTELKPVSYVALVQVEGGLLGLTAVPGPYLLALLFAQGTPQERALRALAGAAKRVTDAAGR